MSDRAIKILRAIAAEIREKNPLDGEFREADWNTSAHLDGIVLTVGEAREIFSILAGRPVDDPTPAESVLLDYLSVRGDDPDFLCQLALCDVKAKAVLRGYELTEVGCPKCGRTRTDHLLTRLTVCDCETQFDEAALDAFAAEGEKAWADVPDPAKWVREIRE